MASNESSSLTILETGLHTSFLGILWAILNTLDKDLVS